MEFSCLLDTSLNLNSNPHGFVEEAPTKQEAESKMLELGRNASAQDELNRVSAENKKLAQRLSVVCENYSELRNQIVEYTSKTNPSPSSTSRKRTTIINVDIGSAASTSADEDSCKKPREMGPINTKISQVHVRTQASSATLIVKDGYQWRKYGQKVTRDNPCPRAYFKCSFAPRCPVKKKVQRSIEDESIVVATYEGEHNHPQPEPNSAPNRSSTPGKAPSSPTITLDLTKPNPSGKDEEQNYLIERMASTLTKDPSLKAAVAAAISRKFLQHNNDQTQKW